MVNTVTLADLNVSLSNEIRAEATEFLKHAIKNDTIDSKLFAENYYVECTKPWTSDLKQYVIKEKPKSVLESIKRFFGFGHRTSTEVFEAIKIITPSAVLKRCLNRAHGKDRHWWDNKKVNWVKHSAASYSHYISQNAPRSPEHVTQKEPPHYREISQPQKPRKAPPTPLKDRDRLIFAKSVVEQLQTNVVKIQSDFPQDVLLGTYRDTMNSLDKIFNDLSQNKRSDIKLADFLKTLFDFKQSVDSSLSKGIDDFDDPSFHLSRLSSTLLETLAKMEK